MKTRFQNSPFKCNLQRYAEAQAATAEGAAALRSSPELLQKVLDTLKPSKKAAGGAGDKVGLCTLNQVDP